MPPPIRANDEYSYHQKSPKQDGSYDLPGWQAVYEELKDRNLEIIAVAEFYQDPSDLLAEISALFTISNEAAVTRMSQRVPTSW